MDPHGSAITQECLGWLPSTKMGRKGLNYSLIYLFYLMCHRRKNQITRKSELSAAVKSVQEMDACGHSSAAEDWPHLHRICSFIRALIRWELEECCGFLSSTCLAHSLPSLP